MNAQQVHQQRPPKRPSQAAALDSLMSFKGAREILIAKLVLRTPTMLINWKRLLCRYWISCCCRFSLAILLTDNLSNVEWTTLNDTNVDDDDDMRLVVKHFIFFFFLAISCFPPRLAGSVSRIDFCCWLFNCNYWHFTCGETSRVAVTSQILSLKSQSWVWMENNRTEKNEQQQVQLHFMTSLKDARRKFV